MEEVKDGFPCVLVTLDNNKKHEFLFSINFSPQVSGSTCSYWHNSWKNDRKKTGKIKDELSLKIHSIIWPSPEAIYQFYCLVLIYTQAYVLLWNETEHTNRYQFRPLLSTFWSPPRSTFPTCILIFQTYSEYSPNRTQILQLKRKKNDTGHRKQEKEKEEK